MTKLNLELDGEVMVFEIPSSWEEVNVQQFADIFKLDKLSMTEIEMSVAVVKIFTGIDEDTLYMMSPENFAEVARTIEFTSDDVVGTKKESIMVGEDEYFIKKDFDKLTMGEMISLELLIEKSDNKVIKYFPEMLCIFLRQKKDNGHLESFKKSFMDRADSFKGISIADVNDLFLFFSDGGSSLERNTKDSLVK